ncbi:hypothetical protein LPJ57_006345 [Coemansia sp. RSA 486]|nr:hypothetical protein LPJ57_006345 [Coemansia sp. RSA 486]
MLAGHRPQDPASFSMHQQQQHQQQQQRQHAVAGSGDHHGQSPQGGYAAFGVPVYLTADSQRTAYPIDLPAPVATQYRDSESASSSVSSQGTLIDTCLSADHHYAVAKQVHQHPGRAHTHMSSAGPFAASQTIQLASGMCEEDVFAAASILMSLRTCKLPC